MRQPINPLDRGVKTNILDPRATAIGLAVALILCAVAVVWRLAATVSERAKRHEIEQFQFGLAEHAVEDFKVSDVVRGVEREASPAEKTDPIGGIDERPDIHMTRDPSGGQAPTYVETIQTPNTTVAPPNELDLHRLTARDVELAQKNKVDIADAPEQVTVSSGNEVGYAIPVIAAQVEEPGDLVKYDTPTPRDRPALYTFNTAPAPGRTLKRLPQSFGDQSAPSFGAPGPANINLFGDGQFLRLMNRAETGAVGARTTVDGALHWLALHQGEDGLWHAEKFDGQEQASLADTGLSVLALLSGGNTTRKGEYRRNVHKGLEAILRNQKEDGSISYKGSNLYTHALCTIALCEAYGRARDERLGAAAQKAADFCAKAVASDGGWRYVKNTDVSDMSVTSWFIQALKTARLAQIKFDTEVFARALVFVDFVTDQGASKDSNGVVTYQFADGQHYGGNDHPALTCAGMMIRQFNGMGVKNHLLVKGAELTRQRPPQWNQKDFYYWYYATYAMHNMGGEYRIWWNQKVRDVLMENQSRGGENAGSWDPKGDHWGAAGGRVYTTALGALCLEVYYRYSDALTSFGAAPDLDELFLE